MLRVPSALAFGQGCTHEPRACGASAARMNASHSHGQNACGILGLGSRCIHRSRCGSFAGGKTETDVSISSKLERTEDGASPVLASRPGPPASRRVSVRQGVLASPVRTTFDPPRRITASLLIRSGSARVLQIVSLRLSRPSGPRGSQPGRQTGQAPEPPVDQAPHGPRPAVTRRAAAILALPGGLDMGQTAQKQPYGGFQPPPGYPPTCPDQNPARCLILSHLGPTTG